MDVVVLGASGGIGAAVAAELASRDHVVTAVNRAGDARVHPAVRTAAADVYDPARTAEVCAGASPRLDAPTHQMRRTLGVWAYT